jgi:hypothetical protein
MPPPYVFKTLGTGIFTISWTDGTSSAAVKAWVEGILGFICKGQTHVGNNLGSINIYAVDPDDHVFIKLRF